MGHYMDAYLLLTIPDATISTSSTASSTGTLSLECVTAQKDDNVYIVIVLGTFEAVIDPARGADYTLSGTGERIYRFYGAEAETEEITLAIPPGENEEIFEGIMAQYTDLRIPGAKALDHNLGDFRGQLVFVDGDSGEVVGEVDQNEIRVTEDPALSRSRADGAVVIDIPGDGTTREVFAKAIPPEQQDWLTKSATLVSKAIEGGTNLLLTSIDSASAYYIARSAPAPKPETAKNQNGQPPPLPPRALALLTDERTRRGLQGVHSFSGHVVRVSHKTAVIVDGLVRRAVGGRPKNNKPRSSASSYLGEKLPPPPRTPSPRPPSYNEKGPSSSSTKLAAPPLPPRRSRPTTPESSSSNADSAQKLRTRHKLVLSADLIWTALDNSLKRVAYGAEARIGDVVEHKYGTEAAKTTALATGTARNIVLVYVDMRGMGRRALLRTAGKEFVKTRLRKVIPYL